MARKMKDSGIEWIGEIPEGWEVSLLKYATRWKSEKGCPDAPVLSLYRDFGVVPKDSRDDNHNVTSLDTSNYKVVDIGDLVINKMKAWQGSMAVSDYRGIVSPAYHVCSITSNKVNKRYLHHLLRNPAYLPEYARLSTGMRIGQWDLGFDDFKNIPFLIPPLDEQVKIADYLDNGCASLDAILDKTRSSIEEYKKLKQAVITQAVTEGTPTMVSSPYSVKLKYLISIVSGEAIRNEQLSDFGKYPVYGGGEIIGFCSQYNTSEGSLIIGRVGARCGCVTHTTCKSWATDNALVVLPTCIAKYMYYVIGHCQLNNLNTSNAQPLITSTKIKNAVVPYFSDAMQQQEIADYLDAKCAEIDKLIAKKEQLVKELESYKKSLIYEVVTGKREV